MTVFQAPAVRTPVTKVIATPPPPMAVTTTASPYHATPPPMAVTTASPYRDNASLVLPVKVSSGAERDHQVIEVATTLLPIIKKNTCVVKPLQGGLSNELFVVSSKDESVLVRIHPPSDFSIVDREVENRVMAWLSREGLAPTFYGRFQNGRVEEFYNGYRPLNCHEMPQYATNVASLMGQMHKLVVPDSILAPQAKGEVWSRIQTWLQLATEASKNNGQLSNGKHSLIDLDKLRHEYTWLKQELTTEKYKDEPSNNNDSISRMAIEFCRQVVFTHMDCQSLNILTNNDGEVRLIDFEYAGLNPRAVDIANTFCEYCDMNNLKANYKKEYPSNDQQNEFLKSYIDTVRPDLAAWLDSNKEWETFLQAMRIEVGKHTLVSHLQWAAWSIAQSSMSAVDFDYIAYAKQRMEGYHYFRDKYWTETDWSQNSVFDSFNKIC